jgi:capsular polysaccharide biosynthesis protein
VKELQGIQLLMNAPFKFHDLEQSNFRAHYEDVAANTLLSIARRKLVIASFVTVALVAAGLLIPQLPRKYSAEALVHPDLFPREMSGGKSLHPQASIDGASVVASEARLIRSDAMVRTVVKRLGLDHDEELPASPSQVSRVVDWIWATIMPETYVSSPVERATTNVRRNLTVTNDTRAYLISISFTAASPATAANVANAFAREYIRAKRMGRLADAVTAATRELAQRSAIYGEKHPSIVQAKADFELARIRLHEEANSPDVVESDIAAGEGVTLAEPSPTPSSPKGLVILGLTLLSALASGISIALWLERRDVGFCSEKKVVARTGVPCLGTVPRFSARAGATLSPDALAALRTVAVGAGLIGAERLAKVAMVTSTLPHEETSGFAAGLAKVLVSNGQRVLLLDTLSEQQEEDGAISLDDVLNVRARAEAFFEVSGTGQLAILGRNWETKGQPPAVAISQRAFRRLLTAASNYFDIVLIVAPPVMLCDETVSIGRNADITLHVVQWNRTPLPAVVSAIRRLRDGAVHVDGIVLMDVNPQSTGKKPRPPITGKTTETAVPA